MTFRIPNVPSYLIFIFYEQYAKNHKNGTWRHDGTKVLENNYKKLCETTWNIRNVKYVMLFIKIIRAGFKYDEKNRTWISTRRNQETEEEPATNKSWHSQSVKKFIKIP